MSATTRLLACGSVDRGDDGAAVLAMRRLPQGARRHVRVEEVGQLSAEQLIDDGDAGRRLVVDCVAGIPTGTIVDLPLAELPAHEARMGVTSSHALAPGQAVALAASLGALHPGDRFIGIGGCAFETGAPLSPQVAGGIDDLVRRVTERLAEVDACA